MSDYIKELEKQNEELQKSLSQAQQTIEQMQKYVPFWRKNSDDRYILTTDARMLSIIQIVAFKYEEGTVWKIETEREQFAATYDTSEEAKDAAEKYIYNAVYPDSD